MNVNQKGEPIFEDVFNSCCEFEDVNEVADVLVLLANKLGYDIVRTNATKYGNTEIVLREHVE